MLGLKWIMIQHLNLEYLLEALEWLKDYGIMNYIGISQEIANSLRYKIKLCECKEF